MTVIRVFEIDGSSFYIVNGKNELLERVQTHLEGYYAAISAISNGDNNLQLRVQKEERDRCLLLQVSK